MNINEGLGAWRHQTETSVVAGMGGAGQRRHLISNLFVNQTAGGASKES